MVFRLIVPILVILIIKDFVINIIIALLVYNGMLYVLGYLLYSIIESLEFIIFSPMFIIIIPIALFFYIYFSVYAAIYSVYAQHRKIAYLLIVSTPLCTIILSVKHDLFHFDAVGEWEKIEWCCSIFFLTVIYFAGFFAVKRKLKELQLKL
jgi:hypothetical protein